MKTPKLLTAIIAVLLFSSNLIFAENFSEKDYAKNLAENILYLTL